MIDRTVRVVAILLAASLVLDGARAGYTVELRDKYGASIIDATTSEIASVQMPSGGSAMIVSPQGLFLETAQVGVMVFRPDAASHRPAAPAPWRAADISICQLSGKVYLEFRTGSQGEVRAEILATNGRSVAILRGKALTRGSCSLVWDRTNLTGDRAGPGVYHVRVDAAGNAPAAGRLVLK